MTRTTLRPARGARFQGLFHSPQRGAFHRSLTVLVRYRSSAVFSLGRWSAPFPAGYHVSGGTHATRPRAPERFGLRDSHPLRWPVPAAFGQRSIRPRRDCRPLRRARPTPTRQRRQPVAPRGFGLLPVRSPLLRESSLFLGVLRCFSSPGAPPGKPGCPAERRAGCPIRRPPDRRLPAPPWGVSSRGHVLHRPPTPRHPPCAHLCGHSTVVDAARPRQGIGSRTGARPRDQEPPGSPPVLLLSRRELATPSPRAAVRRLAVHAPFGHANRSQTRNCKVRSGSLMVCCARTRRREAPDASAAAGSGRPRASGCQRAKHGSKLVRTDDALVEPRGIEPRTSAVQRRRSPG